MASDFRRDRLTWVSYALLAWFAYLQAAPGLVVPHLREEFRLSYTVGGLHVAAFAAGSVVAGLTSAAAERGLGRRRLLWWSALVMAAGVVGLTAGRAVGVTLASVLVTGFGGGLLLATIQATLADHHAERRTVALTEANVAASVAYVVLIGVLSLAASLRLGWRVALLAPLVIPLLLWWTQRRTPIDAPSAGPAEVAGRLPGVFWIAAGMLVCLVAAEWCVTAWGASFVQEAAGVSADTAVSLMGGYFGGVVVGRVAGSRLARRIDPAPLTAAALAVALAGFAVLRTAGGVVQALVGLGLLGIGIGNLFPLGLSLTIAVAPGQAALASGRAVTATSVAVLLAPLLVGALADATSLAAALTVVPVVLALAAAALAAVHRVRLRSPDPLG